MSYSNFTLGEVKKVFNLNTREEFNIFAQVELLKSSELLSQILRDNLEIAIVSNSEKARSEMIIAPILVELKRHFESKINIFSGVEFNVDESKGLNGICDFLVSKSPEKLLINAPVITLVEAKRENLNAGLGQCIAEMVAAQLFNQQNNNEFTTIYGAVTSGTNWRFLKLENSEIFIDLTEYYLQDLDKILGILAVGLN
jgi:hypothetical protein